MTEEYIGKVKIVSTPVIDESIFRYAVHLRLPKDVSINELECLLDVKVFEGNCAFRFVDVIKYNWKDRNDDFMWELICKEDGRTPPIHKYIIYLKSKENLDKNELVYELSNLLEELNIEQIHLYMTLKTIKRFPYEKPTTKTIPIPKSILDTSIPPQPKGRGILEETL